MDVMALVRPEEREGSDVEWFSVSPARLYSNVISHFDAIREDNALFTALTNAGLVSGEEQPAGLTPADWHPTMGLYYRAVRNLPEGALDVALAEYGTLEDPEQQRLHDAVLELARKFFTRRLKLELGRPLGLHILNDPAFRLYNG